MTPAGIVGERLVSEAVFFYYDLIDYPECVHRVSIYARCHECDARFQEAAAEAGGEK